MIGRLLCLIGFHDWVCVRVATWVHWHCYVQHCDRPGCTAVRLER